MANRRDQAEHESMVKSLVIHLKGQRHTNIGVDLFGGDIPDQVYWEKSNVGYIPDVTSIKNQPYIFEVETEDSINDPHTEEEWRLFYANSRQQKKSFIVVVPKGSEQLARQRAESLGITLDDVWVVGNS